MFGSGPRPVRGHIESLWWPREAFRRAENGSTTAQRTPEFGAAAGFFLARRQRPFIDRLSGRPLLGGGVQARAADALDRDEVASVRERTAANLALDRLKTIDREPPDVHATLLSGGWIQRLAPQIGHREGALSTAIPYLQLAHTRSSQCRGIALSLFVFVVMF
jgi:hypothetical protein